MNFEAIGTFWEIEIYDEKTQQEINIIQEKVLKRIHEFDKTYSRFRDDSLIYKIAKKSGKYKLPRDAKALIDFYWQLYKLTDGKVTPLVGQILDKAGYDAAYSLKPKGILESAAKWEEIIDYNFPFLIMKKAAILDFGAAGKGYLVDIIKELLIDNGVSQFLIDAGGDMFHHADDPIKVGLEDPNDKSKVVGIVELQGQALCASSGNRRKWAGMHHIIDPDSAQSTSEVLAVWVVAESTMLADGIATALFFTPAKVLSQKFNFEYFLIRNDSSGEASSRIRAKLF